MRRQASAGLKGRNTREGCRPVGAGSFCEANPGLSPWAGDFRTFGAFRLTTGSSFNPTLIDRGEFSGVEKTFAATSKNCIPIAATFNALSMSPEEFARSVNRRTFLTNSAYGLGGLALASLLDRTKAAD